MNNLKTYFLVNSLKKGNVKTFEETYKAYYSKLHGFAKKFDSTTLQPDDFVQQTFIKLWENRDLLKEDILFDKQIFIICKNIILNQLKRDKKFQTGLDLKNIVSEPLDEQLQQEDQRVVRRLNSLIERLPKKRREIFKLHKINNLTYTEIAGLRLISEKTIANHIYLATLFIRKEIGNS